MSDDIGPALGVYSVNRPGAAIGTITICARDHLSAATFTAWNGTDWSWVQAGQRVCPNIIQGGMLPMQRNEAVQRMEGDWLIFIDDDMVWDSDAVGSLVASWQEQRADFDEPLIMGGLCYRRTPPHQPTLYMRREKGSGPYNYLEYWNRSVVEVDATGCAFLLIPKEAFEAIAGMPFPPLEVRRKMGRPPEFFQWTGTLGEDLRFCEDAKAAGCRIMVDTRIEIGHVYEKVIGGDDFLMEVAKRTKEETAQRFKVNSAMGLPTLSPQRAWDKLGLERLVADEHIPESEDDPR